MSDKRRVTMTEKRLKELHELCRSASGVLFLDVRAAALELAREVRCCWDRIDTLEAAAAVGPSPLEGVIQIKASEEAMLEAFKAWWAKASLLYREVKALPGLKPHESEAVAAGEAKKAEEER